VEHGSISNGTGADIGADGLNPTSPFIDVANLTIANGTFILSSNSGTDVGGSGSLGIVANLNLVGGTFIITNGIIGVRSINLSYSSTLRIGSLNIDCRSLGTNTSLRSPSVVFDNGSVTVVTGAPNSIELGTTTFSGSRPLSTIYT
jgi:hypothetical protein